MVWYQNYMKFHQARSEGWAELDLGDGHKAYALRQADMWRRMGTAASALFNDKVYEGPALEGMQRQGLAVVEARDVADELDGELEYVDPVE